MSEVKLSDIEVVDADQDKAYKPVDAKSKPDVKLNGQTIPDQDNPDLVKLDDTVMPEDIVEEGNADAADAFGRGALQAGTMGFADELSGAAESSHMSGPEYEKARDESRANFKSAAQKSPVANALGNLAGVGIQAAALPTEALAPFGAGVRALQGAGEGVSVGKTLANLGAGLADVAGTGALAGAGMTEGDKLEGAKEGAEAGLKYAGPLVTGLSAFPHLAQLGETAMDSNFGQRIAKTAERVKRTGQSIGSKAQLSEFTPRFEQAQRDVAAMMEPGLMTKEHQYTQNLDSLAQEMVKFNKNTKNAHGVAIGAYLDNVLQSGEPVQIRDTLIKIKDDVHRQIELGKLDASKAKGFMAALDKAITTPPPMPVTVTNTTKSILPTGEEAAGDATNLSPQDVPKAVSPSETKTMSRTIKIGGKDVGLDELQSLLDRSTGKTPLSSSSSVSQTGNRPSVVTNTESASHTLEGTPVDSISPEELLNLRRMTQEGLKKSGDPALEGMYRRSYGNLTEGLEGQASSPEQAAAFKQARQGYGRSTGLEDMITDQNAEGKTVPSQQLLSTLKNPSAVNDPSEYSKFNEMLSLIAKDNPEFAAKLKQQAQSGSMNLEETKSLLDKYINSRAPAPGPTQGTHLYPNIATAIPEMSDLSTPGGAPAGRALLGAMAKADPAKTRAMLPGLKDVAEEAELSNIASNYEPMVSSANPVKAGLMATVLGKRLPLTIGNAAGKASRVGSKFADSASAMINKPVEYLQRADSSEVEQLMANAYKGGKKALSSVLKGVLSKDKVARNAALFMISQNPSFRKDLSELAPGMENGAPADGVDSSNTEETDVEE